MNFILEKKSKVFLIFKDGFSFDSTGNQLTINSGSLFYSPNILYQFLVKTDYLEITYSQIITLQIDPASVIPIASLK